MLIDDNPDDNFFHEREIKKYDAESIVITKNRGLDALEYLKLKTGDPHPDIVFLDINMPGMSGWEFLQEYSQLDKELQSKAIIVMLTTSRNPDDEAKAHEWNFVAEYIAKPLTKEIMNTMSKKYLNK